MRAEHECFDLIVIGGGPAGSTIATLTAQKGYRVLLLERATEPQHKIGESLLPSTVHGICRLLGVSEQISSAGFTKKYGGTLRWGTSPEPWTFYFSPGGPDGQDPVFSYQVDRAIFDEILLKNAEKKGVDVRRGIDVKKIHCENDRFRTVETYNVRGEQHYFKAKFIADASGYQSNFANLIGTRTYSKFFRNVALYCYFKGGKRLPSPHQGNILTAAFDKGWFWYIPISSEITSVGAVIGDAHAKEMKNSREAVFSELIQHCPIIKDYLQSATRIREGRFGNVGMRKEWSYTHSKFWDKGLLLLGDAACFIDPLLSQGVHLGTYSALLGARSVVSVLEGRVDEEQSFIEFEARYRREYGLFYDYLTYLYDMNQSQESYYWAARSLLSTGERANDAFVRLVGGFAPNDSSLGLADRYFDERRGAGRALQAAISGGNDVDTSIDVAKFFPELYREARNLQNVGTPYGAKEAEVPIRANGLVPSADGLSWLVS